MFRKFRNLVNDNSGVLVVVLLIIIIANILYERVNLNEILEKLINLIWNK